MKRPGSSFQLWTALLAVTTGLFVALLLAYHSGASGVRFLRGGATSFGRQHDVQLLRVQDGVALIVSKSNLEGTDELMVVDVAPAPPPFSLLCGAYQPAGFATHPAAVEGLFAGKLSVRPHPVAGERPRVVAQLTAAEAFERFPPMSTCNESCTTFTAAFLLLYAVLAVSGAALWWRGRRARA